MKYENGHYIITFLGGTVKKFTTLKEADLYGANLYKADLRGANLIGAYLREADLYGANLRGANLRGVNLYGANLIGAYLREADLYGANLRGTDFYKADFRGANLYRANLRGSYLRGADLRGADLRGANLTNCKGIISFTGGKHFAFAFKYNDIKYVKIGCITKSVDEWLESKEVAVKEGYLSENIKRYKSFITFIKECEL